VRDETGRSYASSEVTLPSFELTALEAAVAQASAAGARRLEAALVVVAEGASELSLAAVADLGGHGVPVFTAHSDDSGQIVALTQTTT
jgi:hypothetical protein